MVLPVAITGSRRGKQGRRAAVKRGTLYGERAAWQHRNGRGVVAYGGAMLDQDSGGGGEAVQIG